MIFQKGKVSLLIDKVNSRLGELISSVPDYFRYIFALKGKIEQPTIVFVGTVIHARIPRIAQCIKGEDEEMRLILVCKKDKFNDKLSNDSFDELCLFNNQWSLKRIIKKYDSPNTIFHTFGPPYDAASAVVHRAQSSKVLFDYQDLIVSNFELSPPFAYMKKDMVKEKYVLQNVKGIVSHSLELQLAKKLYGNIKAEKLYFPNYVDSSNFETKVSPNLENEIHLVYAGGVYSKHRDRDYFGGGQLHWLVEKLNKQKIHFHIYPSPVNFKADWVDYYEMDKQLTYFHFHQPVKQDILAKELVKYDFGLLPFFHRTNKKSNYKRKYSTTLKLYNYFEAGIPVIIGADVDFQNYIGRRFGGSIVAKWEDFDDLNALIQKNNYQDLLENIQKNREELSLKKNIHKLLDFYKRLKF